MEAVKFRFLTAPIRHTFPDAAKTGMAAWLPANKNRKSETLSIAKFWRIWIAAFALCPVVNYIAVVFVQLFPIISLWKMHCHIFSFVLALGMPKKQRRHGVPCCRFPAHAIRIRMLLTCNTLLAAHEVCANMQQSVSNLAWHMCANATKDSSNVA